MSLLDPLLPELDPIRPTPDVPEPDPELPTMAQPQPTTAPSAAQTTIAQTTRPVTTSAAAVPTTTAPVVTPSSVVTTPAPVATTSSPAVVVPTTTSIAPVIVTTTAAPSFSTTSVAPTTTPVVAPTTPSTTSTIPTATSASSSSVLTLTSTSTLTRPSLVTSVAPSSRSSAAATTGSPDKGGVGGSGLAVGALVGIIIGGLAAIALIAFLVTHSMRKKARSRRTANRSSMFEPWPAPAPVALEDEPYEKSRFDAPSQSYPMQDQSYDPYTNAQQQAYHGETQPIYPGGGYAGGPADQVGAPYNYTPEYNGEYPPQAGYAYPPAGPGYGEMAAGAGVGAVAGAAVLGAPLSQGHENPVTGLSDGMMVRVRVGFVRTLEDELAITPGQQLYLHNQYDDGWSLCEDQNQNRGVVPVSCLEPWTEGNDAGRMPRSTTAESLTGGQRRSSLYQAQNAAVHGQGAY